MKVLSLFDGMSCGYLAMIAAGIRVDRYDAWEIDKYAVQASKHNFPQIMHHGDVFEADFTEYQGYDFLVGGSPCTYWSIAQSPDKRETTASGLGWDLFSQYVRALHEAQPRMFIYENNKSMSKDIRASITETFGFEPICINSALVSAQNRQRLYWVGVRNADGTYRKASIEQPEDRGILLKDVLDSAQGVGLDNGKGYALTAHYSGSNATDISRRRNTQAAIRVCEMMPSQGYRIYDIYGKSTTVTASSGGLGRHTELVAEPMRVPEATTQGYVDVQPVGTTTDGKAFAVTAYYSTGQNAPHTLTKHIGSMAAEPVRVGTMPNAEGEQNAGQAMRIYDPAGKSTTLKANAGGGGGKTGLYATQETPQKDQKVYTVTDGMIDVNGKRYPIKLRDGRYIIRKLTVTECMRLQTVPEWYDFSCVSNTQAYKMLGNGWTVEVIAHLIRSAITSSVFGI